MIKLSGIKLGRAHDSIVVFTGKSCTRYLKAEVLHLLDENAKQLQHSLRGGKIQGNQRGDNG